MRRAAAVLGLAACDYKPSGPLGAEEIIGRLSMGDTVTVTVGDTVSLIPRIYDIRGTPLDRYRLPNGQVLVWSTSNANIATVADGLVRGVSPGRAVIGVTVGGLSAGARVGVIPP
jgi:uncharacterized protein YjdB